MPEFSVDSGRVDYCLVINGKEAVFIEVKQANEDLGEHQEQLLRYAFHGGVELAVLTNGLLWWLFLPLKQGSWERRRFFAVDLIQQRPADAADHLGTFLAREAVESGKAVREAEALYRSREKERLIERTLPDAWRTICNEPDEILVELLQEKVASICGHRPEPKHVARFLRESADVPVSPPPGGAEGQTPSQQDEPPEEAEVPWPVWTHKRPRAYVFGSRRTRVSTFKEILIGLCADLAKLHRGDFARVLTLTGRKQPFFSHDPGHMREPRKIRGTDIYVMTCLSAEAIRALCYKVLRLFGYRPTDLAVEFAGH